MPSTNLPPADVLGAVPELLSSANVPGMSIALIQSGECVWSDGFGVRNAETAEDVSASTVFEAGSLSKPLFAAAVLRLYERGDIDLDAPVCTYVEDDYVPGDGRLATITVRHALSHRTGFPNWRPQGKPLEIEFTPGDQFGYSGEGYFYLQSAVEAITRRPLTDLLQEEILQPLGMQSSSYVWRPEDAQVAATGHDSNGETLPKWKPAAPNAANSLHSTALDFAAFIRELMRVEDGASSLLKRSSLGLMLRPNVRLSESLAWGLGWGIQEMEDGLSFWHGGARPGFRAFVLARLQRKEAALIFTNSDNGHALVKSALDLLLGGEYPVHKRAFHSHL